MDIRAFKQVVVVGGRSYVPFMKLKPNDRREFIEDLLDIRIFSTMNVLLKDKVKQLKEEYRVISVDLKSTKDKVDLQKSFIKKLTSEKGVSLSKIESTISSLDDENLKFNEQMKMLLESEKKMLTLVSNMESASSDFSNIKRDIIGIANKRKTFGEKLTFYKEMTTCPTCTQEIEEGHRSIILKDNENEIGACDNTTAQLKEKFTKIQEIVDKKDKIQTKISQIQETISTLNHAINSNLKSIKALRVLRVDQSLLPEWVHGQ